MTLKSEEARELGAIWEVFRYPEAPLKEAFLTSLTRAWIKKHKDKLPVRSSEDTGKRVRNTEATWIPLSGVPLVGSGTPIQPRRRASTQVGQTFLLIDVLGETRSTQMQLPLDVVERFWSIARDKPAEVDLRIWTSQGFSQPIRRRLVLSSGGGKRLMRRIEMPQIRELPRPLAAVFVRLRRPATFAYLLLPRNTAGYKAADSLLAKHGQQGKGVRRYVIARRGESLAKHVMGIIQTAHKDTW